MVRTCTHQPWIQYFQGRHGGAYQARGFCTSTGEPLAAASFVGVHYRPFVDRVKIPARMIHLQFQGKVGNNLFQYVVARLLAEDFGYELEVEHSVMGGEANATRLTGLLARFEDAPLTLPGRRFSSPIDATASIDNPDFDGYRVDLEAIRSNRDDRRIDVNGFFERYELIQARQGQGQTMVLGTSRSF